MRTTQLHAPTLREAPRDAAREAERLLLRAGAARRLAGGRLALLPLGALAVERLEARLQADLGLAPVHLARAADDAGRLAPAASALLELLARDLRSWRQLPLRLGTLDAAPADAADRTLTAWAVAADPAAAAGALEALVAAALDAAALPLLRAAAADARPGAGALLAPTADGDARVLACAACGAAAAPEVAALAAPPAAPPAPPPGPARRVDTPGRRTVEDVSAFLGVPPSALAKTLVVLADGRPWGALVRGDRELSLPRLARALGAAEVALADDDTVRALTGAPVGFAGPVGLRAPLAVDPEVAAAPALVCGANEADAHLVDVAPGRDFSPERVAPLRLATPADPCPACGGPRAAVAGRVVGRVEPPDEAAAARAGATVQAEDGARRPVALAGLTLWTWRLVEAAADRFRDDRGLAWPPAWAPFQVAVLPLGRPGDALAEAAEAVAAALSAAGLRVLLDDRDERPGARFHDADLQGAPLQVVLGRRSLDRGAIELRARRGGDAREVPLEGVVAAARDALHAAEEGG